MDEAQRLAVWADLGSRIARARGDRKVAALARVAGISATYFRQMEAGCDKRGGHLLAINPSPEVIRRVADAVGLDPADLLVPAGYDAEAGKEPEHSTGTVAALVDEAHAIIDELARRLRQGQ